MVTGTACAAGDSGQVVITVNGPVSYVGPAAGALTPVVYGNSYIYKIADFGTVNIKTAFNLVLQVPDSATAGETICVNVTVTPLNDNNPSNNIYNYCLQVTNSHDPNLKTVFPSTYEPGYDGWFTYTLSFQIQAAHQHITLCLPIPLTQNWI